jgi:NAD(P)-dependent dehydrogenase (short-subunit alcohol dehydrogenase family)/creatinine amidohydrolase/Fe(II)-dependent formamide hydrolase-like protein
VGHNRFAELTWKEAEALEEGWVAILPVGAVEAHGPHLPLRTDGIIAEAMAQAGADLLEAQGVKVVVLPTLDYAAAPFAEGFPGTVSVDPEIISELVASIALSVTDQGADGLVLASAHLDPTHIESLYDAVELAWAAGAPIVFPDLTRKQWALRLTDEFRSGACHAGQYETSVVMATEPDLVREEIRAGLDANMKSLSEAIREGLDTFEAAGGMEAYFGDPASASAEEGRATIEILGTILADAYKEAVDAEDDDDSGEGGVGGDGSDDGGDPAAGLGPDADLTKRGAVVTGAGRGIGAEVARSLAGAGARVVLGARSVEQIEAVAEEIRAGGGEALAVRCDVADEASVASFMGLAREFLDTVDILVNNAGIGHSAPVHKETIENWQRVMAVNATGTFVLTQAVFGGMLDRGWGRVINVASIAGLEGSKYTASYSASKHAVLGLTRSAAAEAEGRGVTVNAICPGYVDTPMTDETVANVMARTGKSQADALLAVLAHAEQPRLVTPEEIAEVVVDLCSCQCDDWNGEVIVMDGTD